MKVNKRDAPKGEAVYNNQSVFSIRKVFDDIDSKEVAEVLGDLPPYTSLLFENILVEGPEGKLLRLPIKFSYHLE